MSMVLVFLSYILKKSCQKKKTSEWKLVFTFKMLFLLLKYKVLGFMPVLLGTLSFGKGKAMTVVAIWPQNRAVYSNYYNYIIIKDCLKGKTKSLFGRHRRKSFKKRSIWPCHPRFSTKSPKSSKSTDKEHCMHVNYPCRRVMNQSDTCLLIFLHRSLVLIKGWK